MNTGKGTDDISDRGKEVLTSIEACVSVFSMVRAQGGKSEERDIHFWLFHSPKSSPK